MRKDIILFFAIFIISSGLQHAQANEKTDQQYPIGKPGKTLFYNSKVKELPGSVVRKIQLTVGDVEDISGILNQWLLLNAEKENGQAFSVWILASGYPSEILNNARKNIARYILLEANEKPIEYINQNDGTSVLPNTGVWKYLLPRCENGKSPFDSKEKKISI